MSVENPEIEAEDDAEQYKGEPNELPPPTLAQVELIRSYIANRQREQIVRLRSFVSSLGCNNHVVEQLRGPDAMVIVAKVTDLIMAEIGHETELKADDGSSKSRRVVTTRRRVR